MGRVLQQMAYFFMLLYDVDAQCIQPIVSSYFFTPGTETETEYMTAVKKQFPMAIKLWLRQ